MSSYPAAPMPPGGPNQAEPPPPNHLVMAIVTTVLCCLPFGIVSLVYANRVNTLWHSGDRAGAMEASAKAKTWWIVAVVAGLVVGVGYLALGLAGVMTFGEMGSTTDGSF